ncbi:hypothetical protein [Streptomyces sp. NPDC000618]|uniref:hypothetical protein n=1 Tax=Streptomyces sp. NPDC000618 TaxID=3154265 RepID=UPI00332F317A
MVPVPESAAQEGGRIDEWAVLESLGRDVFTVLCGDTRADYAELFEEFREDPQSVVRPALTPAVASGITVSSALPYLLPVTAWLLKVATERVAVQAVDALSDATREKIARLLRHRRSRTSAEGTNDAATPDPMDADEEQAARTALAAWAESIGADAAQACAVAEAIIRVLRTGEGEGEGPGR